MKLSRHTNRNLARLLLALALFVQGVVTAHACAPLAAPPAPAMAAMPDSESMPCHEGVTHKHLAPGADNCLTHCSQADQISVDQHEAPAAPINAIVVSIQPPVQHIASPVTPQYVALDTGPPIPIRFCSLLN